jgi:hypothetical protein
MCVSENSHSEGLGFKLLLDQMKEVEPTVGERLHARYFDHRAGVVMQRMLTLGFFTVEQLNTAMDSLDQEDEEEDAG